ncbi:MAG: hypothetical protein IIZ23_03515, partial [Ruminococcus sp.]|nr:hypothetical protein [Ruminococcus sp.]
MKRLLMIFTSALLCMTMLIIGPAQVLASAADNNEQKYISEVKIGMGETSEQASKELLEEGYTILKDGGEYADLNKDAGSKSALKEGPNQKIVYLGYKTTAEASDAITDLAVMNMRGGYSFEDYEKLVNDHMDTQIKPFVDRFIATLTEYRENLKKPQDSANYKRANYYKTLLNKLTDDDTGGQPLGDLLVNETKYEMGDGAYNALSDEEKKNHCDILTLLMQGNGQAVMLMETLLTKSADSSDSTWLNRFKESSLDKLTEAEKKENPNMTPSEINKQLDKKYGDDARKILDKWDAFNEVLINYDNAVKAVDEAAKSTPKSTDKTLADKLTDEELAKVGTDMYKAEAKMVKGSTATEDVVVHDVLDLTEYGDGTMLEFFERDKSEFDDSENIRELYPIVDSLTGGQLAGLDFLSIKDMVVMAITDENGFKDVDLSKIEPASVYQDVNREIYEKGGVALTDAAMRAKATSQEATPAFELSTLGIVLWSSTAAAGLAAAGSAAAWAKVLKQGAPVKSAAILKFETLDKQVQDNIEKGFEAMRSREALIMDKAIHKQYIDNYNEMTKQTREFIKTRDAYAQSSEFQQAKANFDKAQRQYTIKSNVCKYLSVGFALIGAVLSALSIYTTVTEMMEYYKVNFVPIPKYIVDRADITATNSKGETVMIKNQTAYYKAVLCNRTDGSSDLEKKNHEILKDRNDLNGDVGMQWLSLYSVKYENGTPILADSLKCKMGSGDIPDGYTTGIHRFGEKNAFNLTSRLYCYNDPNDGTYVYFKNDTATVKDLTASGSTFSGGVVAIGVAAGILGGVALTLALSV